MTPESKNKLNVYIGTWNMAGVEMNTNENLFDWLFPIKDMKPPDLYIVGFQEIVALSATNIVFSSNSNTVETYKNLLFKNLNKIGK